MTLGGPAPSVGGFRRLAKGGTAPAAADAPGACQQEPPGRPGSWGPDPKTPRTIRADAPGALSAAAGPVGRRTRGELTPRRRLRAVRAPRGSIALQVLALRARGHSSSPPRHQRRSTDRPHPQSPSRRRNLPHASSPLRRIGLYLTHSCTYRSRTCFCPILITP